MTRPAVGAARSRPLVRAPLFAQMFGLIVLGLAAAQAINLAVVYLVPPPAPEFYRVSEIARVLAAQGGPVAVHDGRRLAATVRKGGLAQSSRITSVGEFLTAELAARLSRPQAQVRLALLDAQRLPVRHSVGVMRRQFSPQPVDRGADHFVVAPFEAAVRRADGRWTVLRVDAGLLGTWQERVLVWFAVSALALAPVAYLLSRRLAQPFAAFAAAAERLGRDPRALPLDAAGPVEIRQAVTAFNEMQERLRRYVDDRTAMIGAIAHDLRTPLTRLRFRIDAAPATLQAKMNADVDEMEQMVAEVMAFVRDASHAGERRPLALQALVAGVAEEMADTGMNVAMLASPLGAADAVVDGDPLALRRLVSNLFDNAVKFGGQGRARVYAADGSAVLEVEDEGPGVPEAQRETMFEPFHRAEPSRSRQTGGAGLGLAVVRTIARAHGGDAELENRPGGGLCARARLPLAQVIA